MPLAGFSSGKEIAGLPSPIVAQANVVTGWKTKTFSGIWELRIRQLRICSIAQIRNNHETRNFVAFDTISVDD